ncbi:MAG: nicotinate-nucleotide adenylyltransferase [Pseudomonadales bacterium]
MICLFGGTFDPVHVGHLHAARVVCDVLRLDQIRMLLSARPGHRSDPGAPVEHRWRMLELACAEDERLLPDDTEVRRAARLGRPSYTVETLEEVRQQHPDAVVAWVVGSDAYRELMSWHRWREVFDLTNLVVLHRPGAPLQFDDDELAALTRERRSTQPLRQPAGGVLVLEAAMRDVSATRIRRGLASGGGCERQLQAVADLLPAAVYTYINEHHLYGVVSDA